MTTLRLMAEEGRAWPLLDGTGMIYGMYVISRVSETGEYFLCRRHPGKLILRCHSPALMNHWPRFMAISVNRRNRSSVRRQYGDQIHRYDGGGIMLDALTFDAGSTLTPDYMLMLDSRDITGNISDRLMSMTLTDNRVF